MPTRLKGEAETVKGKRNEESGKVHKGPAVWMMERGERIEDPYTWTSGQE